MSFSINEAKVKELTTSNKNVPFYEVSPAATVEGLDVKNYGPYYTVSGTSYAAPMLVTPESREHLMTLRRNIEESGVPLKSVEDLSKDIDEMRRGNR
jgi:hypothetical protein